MQIVQFRARGVRRRVRERGHNEIMSDLGQRAARARVWQPYRASFPCAASPDSAISVSPSRASRRKADMSEGCDGNSICLSLTPSPSRLGMERSDPSSLSLTLTWHGTKRRRRQMKYFIQPPRRRLRRSPIPSYVMHNNEAPRRLFLMRGMQSGIDCRCLSGRSFI